MKQTEKVNKTTVKIIELELVDMMGSPVGEKGHTGLHAKAGDN
jgi:hypothetical protein